MCELLGISGASPIYLNEYLKTFFSRSSAHPNGWGLALLDENEVRLEKEPVTASKSGYLKNRLRSPVTASNMMAHIRLATRGSIEYENCHPFVMRDVTGRNWTLIHNGTIFNCPILNKYIFTQHGQTDSERILLFIVDRINTATEAKGSRLTDEERFEVIDQAVCDISLHNKVNLIIYDGSLFYVHKNLKNSLFQKRIDDAVIFSTVPLDLEGWQEYPMTILQAFKNGKKKFSGTDHGNEYIDNQEDMKLIYLDYAGL